MKLKTKQRRNFQGSRDEKNGGGWITENAYVIIILRAPSKIIVFGDCYNILLSAQVIKLIKN